MAEAVRVEGLRELNRAFKLYGQGLEKGVREALEAAAEVVRPEAQTLAISSISRIRVPGTKVDWSEMRVGVSKHTSFVAPVQRGTSVRTGRGRSKFKGILLQPMERALENNIPRVERELGDALDDLGRMWSRV